MHGEIVGERGFVERNRASDGARAVLGDRGCVREGVDVARGDSLHIGAVVRWHVKTPKEDRGKHLLKPEGASAVLGLSHLFPRVLECRMEE